MAKISSLLQERFKQGPNTTKMAQLVQRSSEGTLSSFEGIFNSSELTDEEKDQLKSILDLYQTKGTSTSADFTQLCNLTVEVKAITKQAILLHGERIQKVQQLLKSYQDGAFSAWLKHTYGNRQTPYNLLLYYEFYNQLPISLRPKLDHLPKQAVYTLASRKGALDTKIQIIESYNGQSKQQILELIRRKFPLAEDDARRGQHPILTPLKQLFRQLNYPLDIEPHDKQEALALLKACIKLVNAQV